MYDVLLFGVVVGWEACRDACSDAPEDLFVGDLSQDLNMS